MTNASNADLVEFYDAIYRENAEKWSFALLDAIAFASIAEYTNNPEKVMDFGCGNGHTLEFFSKRWRNAKYTGIDISNVALEIARKKLPDASYYNAVPVGEKWDLIIMMGVLEHMPDISGALEHISGLLEEGGYLYIVVPNCLAYSDSKEEGFRQSSNEVGQEEWHLKRSTWEGMLMASGLKPVQAIYGPSRQDEFGWILRKDGA